MSKNEIIFERSSQSKIKGFKDLNLFDDFIQTALDKYNYTSEIPKLDESAEKFHDYIINEESQIPDLIIYNKTFNKNDCYSGYYNFGFNKFPRKKFVLNAQKNSENKENKQIEEKNNLEENKKEDNNDVNIKEKEEVKINEEKKEDKEMNKENEVISKEENNVENSTQKEEENDVKKEGKEKRKKK